MKVRHLAAGTIIVWLSEDHLPTLMAAFLVGNASCAEMSGGIKIQAVR